LPESKGGGAEGEKYVAASAKVAADNSEKYSTIQGAIDAIG
jgi:hypothetical protein